MDPEAQSIPAPAELTQRLYTVGEWLMFYKNTWTRILAARTIDVQSDISLLERKGPEEMVPHATHMGLVEIPVKERLAERRELVRDAIECLAAIDVVMNLGMEEMKELLSAETPAE